MSHVVELQWSRQLTVIRRYGSAYKHVKTVLIIEAIAEELRLNDVTSLGHGWHHFVPEINISRVDLVQWAGLSINQYRTGHQVVRGVRRAVEIMESSHFQLSEEEEHDIATFRFVLANVPDQDTIGLLNGEREALRITIASLNDLASLHSV